ncbi:CpaF family protein [Sinimarinibacterium flocculans]|uniref:Pilus assembly protein CpaF n=1 Tax=Sinimarinibacterium flocculans TaxID=985250 RepID=A0A318EHY4_9GAMM|nr:CpaF family protein [Sinimarinibacterium flocculans]PXV70236.1 pilus assembly protein CpaF [Sinimarinibacterium flocculans]
MNAPTPATDPQITRFRLSDQYQQLKNSFHRHLIQQIEERDLDIDRWDAVKIDRFVTEQMRRYVVEQRLPVNQRESEALARDARDELMGFGPIQGLIDDDSVNDIVVNGPATVFIEREGRLYTAPVRFFNDAHVIRVIQRILAPIGRRVDESTPMVDARLPDGSRVNAIIPPIALDGPCLSIRKFRKQPLSADDLLRYGTLSEAELHYLKERVEKRTNLIVVGGTGSGKTTFLNLLSQWIPPDERIITVEDAAELRLNHGHVVRLETRPPNLEGERAVSARDLVRNALRMRPDRIIVGEVRGDEVLDMLQAMNTGHDGSMTTIHANSTRDAVHRLELLAGFAGYTGSEVTFRGQVASAIQLLVHVSRLKGGERRVMSVTEVLGLRGHELLTRELFRYDVERGQHVDCREVP